MKRIVIYIAALFITGCLGMPESVKPVHNFELDRYLGRWYEIARLDHSFEQGLQDVSAEYVALEKEGIAVINRGYDSAAKQWQQAEGKAFFVNHNDVAHLQVSFFGPFYSSYVIFELDQENYQYAFVSGPTLDYLWLLSRKPTVDSKVLARFVEQAKAKGFDTEQLIYVKHTQ